MKTKMEKLLERFRDWRAARHGFIRVVAFDGDHLAEPFYSSAVPRPGDILNLANWSTWEVTEVAWIAVRWNGRCYVHLTVEEYNGPRA